VDDNDPDGCFLMWWPEGEENPNYEVAKNKASFIVNSATASSFNFTYLLFTVLLVVYQSQIFADIFDE